MTGVTAAAVGGFLKAKSGNPAYAEAFDPSVIGATLEVTAMQHLYQLNSNIYVSRRRLRLFFTG